MFSLSPYWSVLQLVDSEVVMLSAHWEKKRTSLSELQEQLQQLPALLQDVESLMASLGKCDVRVKAVSVDLVLFQSFLRIHQILS